MSSLSELRQAIRQAHRANEQHVIHGLIERYAPDKALREQISHSAADLVEAVRAQKTPGLMDVFLAEYGLSTDEGVALMCLAEALLRVPDAQTMDELIEDKIAPSAWGEHLGQSSSSLVNASTWALLLSGKLLSDDGQGGLAHTLSKAVRRLGEPVIRAAVKRAMTEMGHNFVLGRTIEEAMSRGAKQSEAGYTFSYDMLGEAALTAKDAEGYFKAYADTIASLAQRVRDNSAGATDPHIVGSVQDNPGISIKLSALHPRYDMSQHERVMAELVPKVLTLAVAAKEANIGFNIDAEEAARLDLSLDVIEAVLRSDLLSGWRGFGVVVQAYGKRASGTISWLNALAHELDRHLMVRLVKGAYWDTEIKLAQVDGVVDFPVLTSKAATDCSYLCCAMQLLERADRLYPQFATHNAHTMSAILAFAKPSQPFEFQRLHGMGDTLHALVMQKHSRPCRVYAPVGTHRDLLAYLVRRLLENGANSSFLNQLVDESISADQIALDPFDTWLAEPHASVSTIRKPADLYAPIRENSAGWDLTNPTDIERFISEQSAYESAQWNAVPIIANDTDYTDDTDDTDHTNNTSEDIRGVDETPKLIEYVLNPNNTSDKVATRRDSSSSEVQAALSAAQPWSTHNSAQRRDVLLRAAQLYEDNAGELFTVLCREAGKTATDAIAELREAVDFLRYYAIDSLRHDALPARGLITCISPWNFPLAIFTGQLSAALAAGNGVLAKPAEPTPTIAMLAVRLLHKAGVPKSALQLLPGPGESVGQALTSDSRIDGVCFTGSTAVAHRIHQSVSEHLAPDALFIAETGGLNAMMVDSSALPEQAVQDIVDSAFRSAGQRCSALRLLYVQKDIADELIAMLLGAMDELNVANSALLSSDVGPLITKDAQRHVQAVVDNAASEGRLIKQLPVPEEGLFVGPAVISVEGMHELEQEVFGPVLHVATFDAHEIPDVVQAINDSGYGLTFGLHTRIDSRVQDITDQLNVGNIYVNRNQIGAVVGTQPFGGEGLSGTGPKAGGPEYLARFKKSTLPSHRVFRDASETTDADLEKVQQALLSATTDTHQILHTQSLPGPTGESNRLSTHPRGTILCLGPTIDDVHQQMVIAEQAGCKAVGVAPGLQRQNTVAMFLNRDALRTLNGFAAVALWSEVSDLQKAKRALAARTGPVVPLIATNNMSALCTNERHLCVDTTAAGGNTQLLSGG